MKSINWNVFVYIFICIISLSCSNEEENEILVLTIAPHKVKAYHPVACKELDAYEAFDSNNKKMIIYYIKEFDDVYEEGYTHIIEVEAIRKHKEGDFYVDELETYDYCFKRLIEKIKED